LRSGPQVGERPLPFTSNLVTGPHRGQQYCYVCELKEEPVALVFARHMTPPTGHLMRRLQAVVREHPEQKLFGWVVFLGEGSTAAERDLENAAYQFARANEAAGLAVSALGDPQGPPGYLIAPEAEVTVLLYRRQKVVANLAFRASEWNTRAADQVIKEIPQLFTAPAAP
jgi:hypothetical protein